MSLSVGGLGVLSLRRPLVNVAHAVLGKGELRAMLCVIICLIVVLLLASFTNPSENSFRAYLTEQSFRQHLSRLDEDPSYQLDEDLRPPLSRGVSTAIQPRSLEHKTAHHTSAFHFANRAAISLRTPKHVFRSFGVFTIAAVVPITTREAAGNESDRDGYGVILDSWFIGAFGRWWRGGIVEAWYQDVLSRSKDEEGWRSGILGMKALNDYNGLPFTTKNVSPPSRPPRLRNRERSSQRQPNGPLLPRSTTPPPLPKSATLPLHATRPPAPRTDRVPSTYSSPTPIAPEQPQSGFNNAPSPSRPLPSVPLSQIDQTPAIAELLRQITQSKASIHDLRTQMSVLQASAAESHAALQSEVDLLREHKKMEDATRLEIKSKTKALEESKRSAESSKRDVDKRLKAAEDKRDAITRRIQFLDRETGALQERLQASTPSSPTAKKTDEEVEIAETLERRRREIKIAEDVVSALNARAKELEESLAEAKERLNVAREQAEIRRRDRSFSFSQFIPYNGDFEFPWPEMPYEPLTERADVFPPSEFDSVARTVSSDVVRSPRPANLSLSGISNFNVQPSLSLLEPLTRLQGYSMFDEDPSSLVQPHTHSTYSNGLIPAFAPFANDPSISPSPNSTGMIPAALLHSLGVHSPDALLPSPVSASRSFQSDNDPILSRGERRGLRVANGAAAFSTSPTSTHLPTTDYEEHDPFEVRFPDDRLPQRTHSDPPPHSDDQHISGELSPGSRPRRWFSASATKKGLNPDAKVFRFPSRGSTTPSSVGIATPPVSSFDALNPTGLVPSTTATTSSALHRAFAPSPAEREVFQRAFGGSTNASLERLPTLPDVGCISIPNSPTRGHAHAQPVRHNSLRQPGLAQASKLALPGWMQNLPRIRKPNFSPWDDDEEIAEAAMENKGEKV